MNDLADRLEEYGNNSSNILEKHVIEYILESYGSNEDIKCFFSDLLQNGCQSGMIGELIYYGDTNDFYDRYEDEIETLVGDMADSMGYSRPMFIDSLNGSAENMTQEKNLLAWFGFEETARVIADSLGIEW